MSTSRNSPNRTLSLLALAGIALSGLSLPAFASDDPYANLPSSLVLTGTVRDFKERTVSGGHADFELNPGPGFGHYMGIVANELSEDGKPVYASGGFKVTKAYKDSSGRARVSTKDYIGSLAGDVSGTLAATGGGQVTSASSFDQWFRDVEGVNASKPLSITLNRQTNSNVYTFNDKTDNAFYTGLGGFFPINGQLYGNSKNATTRTSTSPSSSSPSSSTRRAPVRPSPSPATTTCGSSSTTSSSSTSAASTPPSARPSSWIA
jgi:hypothetical protein